MTHSINYNIDKELKKLILNVANDNPAPLLGTVSKVSDDGRYIDVNLRRGGTLPSIKLFSGVPEKGKEVLLVFIEGDINEPRAFIEDYTPTIPCNNLVFNGNFNKYEGNHFLNWTGGKLTDKSYYGDRGCELEEGATIISDIINITSLNDIGTDLDAFTVSFVWLGGGFSIEVLDDDNNLITALPSVLGTKQSTGHVDTWSFQRYNYMINNVDAVKLRFTNLGGESTYLDGIRIWQPDDYQEWFPHKDD